MCLIALSNETGGFLDEIEIAAATDHNPDGVGVMWLSGNRVRTRKHLSKLWTPDRGRYAVHWRYATSGAKSRKGCHPHMIMSEDWGDPYDLAVMHNGVLPQHTDYNSTLSDTMLWVRDVLRPMLRKDPASILQGTSPFWDQVCRDMLDSDSKALFCGTPIGFIAVPTISNWPTSPSGLSISNTYSLRPRRRSSLSEGVGDLSFLRGRWKDDIEMIADPCTPDGWRLSSYEGFFPDEGGW